MKKLGVAVIGSGFWGQNHARVFRNMEETNLIAVCDSNENKAKEVAAKFGVQWYADIERLLLRNDVEAVTVCTPTTTHHDVATQAVKVGKHVLVEKPMTNTVEEAKKLVSLARERGVCLMPGHIERFNPAVQRVKKMIVEGKLGQVILVIARRVTRWPERIGDVGVIKDSAIHDIDIMCYLLEDYVKSVYARAGSLRHKLEDFAEILLRFSNGETGFIDANWLTPRKIRTLIVTGSEATATLDYLTQEITLEDSEKIVKPIVKWEEPLFFELKHFATCVLESKNPLVTGEDGIRAIEICNRAEESAETGKVVYLS